MLDTGLNYSELRETRIILEARSSNSERPLDQSDFENIEINLIYLQLDLKTTPDFGIVKMGLSQGGVWIACKDIETADFVTQHVPKIKPPKHAENTYLYTIFGPDNRPYEYFKNKRYHTREQPFKCDSCEKSFSLNRYLTIHKRRIHATYSCDLCGEAFCLSSELTAQISYKRKAFLL